MKDLFKSEYEIIRNQHTASLYQLDKQISELKLSKDFHTSYRIKDFSSLVQKMKNDNLILSGDSALLNINDIGGYRIVCPLLSDVYNISNYLKSNFSVVCVKDYIKHPKDSGYRSLHIIVRDDDNNNIEIQLRTSVMHVWAELDHSTRYKFQGDIPASLKDALHDCATNLAISDIQMSNISNSTK